jgi:hypothetical protein
MNVGTPWVTIGRAANHAGRWTNIPNGDYLFGGSGATLRAASLRKPAIEKEARFRPQLFIFSRSRMGTSNRCSCEGGSRDPASALRLLLGAESSVMQMLEPAAV